MKDFLEIFFKEISELEESLTANTEEKFGNIFILGLPRSGTTLLSQIVYQGTNCGCVNNFMARFWQAPLVGARISALTIAKNQNNEMASFGGQTKEIDSPHEFSKFWHEMMGWSTHSNGQIYKSKPPRWDELKSKILNLNYIYRSPFVWKPLELITDDISGVVKLLDKAIFVYVDRRGKDVGSSILNIRNSQPTPEALWGSIPRNIDIERLKNMGKLDQIVEQINYLRNHYLNVLSEVPKERLMVVRYDEVCRNPMQFLHNLSAQSSSIGAGISVTNLLKPQKVIEHKETREGEMLKEILIKKVLDDYLYI